MNPVRNDSNPTVTVHANVDRVTVDLFERLYPRCRTRFINLCMKKATESKVFFDKVFFSELLLENGNDSVF